MAFKKISAEDKENMLAIDDLVVQFQNGNKGAGEELMRLFGCHPKEEIRLYIGKFFKVLRRPSLDLFDDKDLRKFVNLFIEDANIRRQMIPFYQSSATKLFAMKKMRRIALQVLCIPDDDLKQELSLMFLEQAKRYKCISKNINFPGYLYNSYRFRVGRFVNRKVKIYEPYEHMYDEKKLIPFDPDRYIDSTTEIRLDDRSFTKEPLLLSDDDLGNSWERGITCGPKFKDLTQLQRIIVKLYYQDEMTDKAIANKMSMHINTIHKNRVKAVELIRLAMERLFKEGYEE